MIEAGTGQNSYVTMPHTLSVRHQHEAKENVSHNNTDKGHIKTQWRRKHAKIDLILSKMWLKLTERKMEGERERGFWNRWQQYNIVHNFRFNSNFVANRNLNEKSKEKWKKGHVKHFLEPNGVWTTIATSISLWRLSVGWKAERQNTEREKKCESHWTAINFWLVFIVSIIVVTGELIIFCCYIDDKTMRCATFKPEFAFFCI